MLRFAMLWIFLPTIVAAGFFSDHIDKYLNKDIEPCDDFYGHVCSNAETSHSFHIETAKWFSNFIQQIVSPTIREFRVQAEGNFESFPDLQMEPGDIEALEQFFNQSGFVKKDHLMFDFFPDHKFLEAVEAFEAQHRLMSSPHYNTLKSKISKIFGGVKDILIHEFSEAPWTKRHPQLVKFLETVKLISIQPPDLGLEKETIEIKQRYESCLGITANQTKALASECIAYAVDILGKRPIRDEFGGIRKFYYFMLNYYYFTFSFNAHYISVANYVELSPALYTLEEDELPYMLGSLDFALAHEIGHVFFRTDGAIPLNSECIRKHMQSTCDEYMDNKIECTIYDLNQDGKPQVNSNYSRLGDDASDWIGMHAGLVSLRKHFPDVFNGADNHESTEIMKKFFYAHAVNWCFKYRGGEDIRLLDEKHSPRKVRVNGIPSLFPEFSEVFQCKRGSRMAKAATCLPFAGAGAPTRKKQRLE